MYESVLVHTMVTTRSQTRELQSYISMVAELKRIKQERVEAAFQFMMYERGKETGTTVYRDRYLEAVTKYRRTRDALRAHPAYVRQLGSPECSQLFDELDAASVDMKLHTTYADMSRALLPALKKMSKSPHGLELLRTDGTCGSELRTFVRAVIQFVRKSQAKDADEFPYYAGFVMGLCKACE